MPRPSSALPRAAFSSQAVPMMKFHSDQSHHKNTERVILRERHIQPHTIKSFRIAARLVLFLASLVLRVLSHTTVWLAPSEFKAMLRGTQRIAMDIGKAFWALWKASSLVKKSSGLTGSWFPTQRPTSRHASFATEVKKFLIGRAIVSNQLQGRGQTKQIRTKLDAGDYCHCNFQHTQPPFGKTAKTVRQQVPERRKGPLRGTGRHQELHCTLLFLCNLGDVWCG